MAYGGRFVEMYVWIGKVTCSILEYSAVFLVRFDPIIKPPNRFVNYIGCSQNINGYIVIEHLSFVCICF